MANERDCSALMSLLAADRLPVLPAWNSVMRQAATALISRDLVGKSGQVAGRGWQSTPLFRTGVIATGPTATLSAESAALNFANELPNLRQVDVLVICPLPKELNPSSIVFGFDPFSDENDNFDGHKIFYTVLDRGERDSIMLAVSVLTQARNVNAALETFKLLLAFRRTPELVLLSGIGGGVRGKTQLGSVVVSSKVIDVSSRRKELGGDALRDDEFPVDRGLLRQLRYLPARLVKRDKWDLLIRESLSRLAGDGYLLPPENDIAGSEFKVDDGIVVAGEDLIADGSLPEHLRVRDDRIRACDMEGSGFAQGAEESKTPWAVFRGISDYGEPDKSDEWQALAAFSAALASRRFLETEFRLRREIKTISF